MRGAAGAAGGKALPGAGPAGAVPGGSARSEDPAREPLRGVRAERAPLPSAPRRAAAAR